MAASLMAAPKPKSSLGYYRILSPNASLRVSPLCLGAMNFGDAWKGLMGECDQKTTEGILDFYYEQGGNFIDTANNYQAEESEKWIGEWMAKRGNRDQMVVATKFTTAYRGGHGDKEILVNTSGNGTKSLHTSVSASLKKLQTDYIDLLYVHWWDWTTSIPELMQSLNHQVALGRVLYLGASDIPAWVVSKANEYARNHGLRGFSVYQGNWAADKRDFEREIIPMCVDEGMGLAPWGALGGGNFKTEEQRSSSEGRNLEKMGRKVPESAIAISKVLEKIAAAKGIEGQLTSVALAYVMHKTPYVFPIVGGRKVDHLKGNIEALSLDLTDEDIKEIEDAVPFDLGFPGTMVGNKPSNTFLIQIAGQIDYMAPVKPLPPHKKE